MKNRIFIFVLLVFITGCSDIPTPGKGSSEEESNADKSKKTGDRITSALAAYRADHLAYPDNLELLVPKYIPKINPPLSGNQNWLYKTYEAGQRYKLGFKGDTATEPECWFDSEEFHWVCDKR